jgi:hypothetical protein
MNSGLSELRVATECAPFWDDAAVVRAMGLPRAEFEKIFFVGVSPAGVAAMRTLFKDAQAVPDLSLERKADIRQAGADLKALVHLVRGTIRPAAFAVLRNILFRRIYNAIIDSYCDTLFKKALAFGKVTAWICSSDDTAIKARAFLAGRSIRVPRDISIIGFDNKLGSTEEQITSYDFNIGVMALHIMRYLFAPEISFPGAWGKVVEIEGFLIERAST